MHIHLIRYALNDQAIVTGLSIHLPTAEPKHRISSSYTHREEEGGIQSSTTIRTNLRNISWDLAGLGGTITEEENTYSVVDYDVVIPWVLRNMVKSAGDQVLGHHVFTTGCGSSSYPSQITLTLSP